MSCLHPFRAIRFEVDTPEGKKYRMMFLGDRPCPDGYEEFLLPCGDCIECRKNKALDWSSRALMEMQSYSPSEVHFVTLTYSDENLPFVHTSYELGYEFEDDLEELPDQLPTLSIRDVQLFFKRLRKRWPDSDIRYMVCGEYGPTTARPHYHMILYGVPLTDLKPWRRGEKNDLIYRSQEIENVWPLGHVEIGRVTSKSVGYVAGYVSKKLSDGPVKEFLTRFPQLTKPFIRASKRPALGRRWYEENKEGLYSLDRYISTEEGPLKVKLPRYFDRLFADEFPDEWEKIKLGRIEAAKKAREDMLRNTDKSEREYLDDLEKVLEARRKNERSQL